jgi:hypothetical protein
MSVFSPGMQVFWWKRITRMVEYPYRAEVVSVGSKRVTISVEDPEDGDRFIRHVAPQALQPVAGYFEKAVNQVPAIVDPVKGWGKFTRYLEIGNDLWPVRQVDVFENANMLSYHRTHWVDEFGMLGDARINRNRKHGPWGHSQEINAAEFEGVWTAARISLIWPQQVATAKMAKLGAVPIWLTVQGWRPSRTRR